MRKILIIVLSAVLAAAIVSLLIVYREYGRSRGALVVSEQKLVSLDAKIAQLNKEQDALRVQAGKSEEYLQLLENAKQRISELESAERLHKESMTQLQEKLRQVDTLKAQAGKSEEYLQLLENAKQRISELERAEVLNRESMAQLEEKLRQVEEKYKEKDKMLLSLKGELLTKETALKGLQACSGLREKTEELEKKCKEKEEAIVSLKSELSAKDALLTGLKADLAEARSRVVSLKEQAARDKKEEDALVTKLQAELAKAKAEALSLRKDLVRREKELQTLKKHLLELKGQRAELESQINQMKSAYDAILSDLKTQIQNKEVTISKLEQKLSITFVDRILFPFGKANITPEGRRILAKVGNILKNVKRKQIRVIGHTDKRPILRRYRYKFPSNWELSAARAAAVVRFFQEEIGLDPKNMEAVGRSFYDPVAGNETEKGRAQNRRVNIVIGPKIQ